MTARFHSDIITKLANSNSLPLINTSLINNRISNEGKKRFDNIINSMTSQWKEPEKKEEKFQMPVTKEKYELPKIAPTKEAPPQIVYVEPERRKTNDLKITVLLIVLVILFIGFAYTQFLQKRVDYIAYLETGCLWQK